MSELTRSDAIREIESLQKVLSDVYCRTRSSTIKQQLISEQESLVQWAKDQGKLISEERWQNWVASYDEIASGQEHFVYLDPSSDRVIKITRNCAYGLSGYAHEYLNYLLLSNEIFHDDETLERNVN